MGLVEIIVLGFALSMDAVAVSIAQGLRMQRPRLRDALLLAVAFGLFQAIMPLGGWVLSFWFAGFVSAVAPWIAFGLLLVLGVLMIREGFSDDDEDEEATPSSGGSGGTLTATGLTLPMVFALAVATSIDAAAVGVTFGVLDLGAGNVFEAVIIIGCTTFLLSLIAVLIGSRVGERLGKYAEFVGGAILILIGLRILLAGLGVFG